MTIAAQHELSDPPTDIISAIEFGPNGSSRLLVSSWDRHLHLYEAQSDTSKLLSRIEHRAPILDTCFGPDDKTAYTAGLDWDVSHIDLETSTKTVLSTHKDGVKAIVFSPAHNLLISAGWDCTLHLHLISADGHIQRAPATITLPAKPYALSLTGNKCIVAMASREISIYELDALKTGAESVDTGAARDQEHIIDVPTFQRRESSIKFMTRTICGMPDDQGYAVSSIEGRVGVEYFDPAEASQARNYAFKCHRQDEDEDTVAVFPVNALAFHPVRKTTFASGGGDGFVVLWDGVGKRRIRQYQSFPDSVCALAWSGDGSQLAVGVSPGFEDGTEEVQSSKIKVFLRSVPDAEVKGKPIN